MTEHEHALELMPGYALGNLSTEESSLVERHSAACPACAQLLKQYQTTVDDLPEAIVMYEPPAELKARILARAAAGARNQPVQKLDAGRAKWNLAALLPRLAPALGGVGLAVIALLAVSNMLLWSRLKQLEDSSMLRTIALQGGPAAPQALGTLVISLDGEHGTLVVDGLPPLDPDQQQYQVWLLHNGQRYSGGVFSVSKDGYGALWVNSPAPLASCQSVGVTIEPVGGSPGPTGERVLGGDL